MISEGYFKEKQSFPFWIVMSIGVILMISPFLLQEPFGELGKEVIASSLLMLLIVLLFLVISIRLRVDEQGIRIRFRPFVNKDKLIRWDELESVRVRKYSPIREFGGWGYRIRIKKRAYTLYGNWGLDLRFKNGKSLLIGVQKHEHLHLFLKERIYPTHPDLEVSNTPSE
jgi:hypothetical protein